MKNPLSDVLDAAQVLIEQMEASLMAEYGLPLYVDTETKPVWPSDPEAMSPEEMAVLVQTRGKDAVNTWLAEHFSAKAEPGDGEPE